MLEVYPCRIIITDSEDLTRYYNADPESALTSSRCTSVKYFFSLFQQHKIIETLVLVNGSGSQLMPYLEEYADKSGLCLPDIVTIDVSDDCESAVRIIRNAISISSRKYVWADIFSSDDPDYGIETFTLSGFG